jgi:branched-chain amino acid transport system ATP-binding protein
MRPLLRLRDVEARYGAFVALQNVSLIVPEGSVVALLGPNGAGKTTLLRTISGMLPPNRGEITFDGEPIHGLPDHRIAAMGLAHIPQGRGIFPHLTVAENLMMAAYAGSGGDGLGEVFGLFPVLESRMKQDAGTLSGGEQQMLSLSRAVMSPPRLLAVDELSLGLAPILVEHLFRSLETIRDRGTSILLVEQYVGHALRIADIVVVLHKGRVRFIGEPGEVALQEGLVGSYLGGGRAGTSKDAGASADASAPEPKPRRVRKGS